MKTYILNLTTYTPTGSPIGYDFETASSLWAILDRLNERLRFHRTRLDVLESGSLLLTADPMNHEAYPAPKIPAAFERLHLSRILERIADEFGAFEMPSRRLMSEPELNEMLRA